MSKANPKKAMAALLPHATATIRPMTLGVYAALERVSSPLVTGKDARDALELLPSLYLLTHDPREVFRGNILDLAMQWADTVPVSAMDAIRRAAIEQMRAFTDVLPESDGKAPQKKTTDGSPSTPTGPRANTTGASTRSCGASPSARSRSCGVRKSSGRSSRASFRCRR